MERSPLDSARKFPSAPPRLTPYAKVVRNTVLLFFFFRNAAVEATEKINCFGKVYRRAASAPAVSPRRRAHLHLNRRKLTFPHSLYF